MAPLLEVPIFDPAHGALAAAHGAARLELNAAGSYAHGGTTPSVAELRALKASLPTPAPAPDPRASAAAVPVRVMIRPRGPPPPPRPDFVYTAAERAAMAGAIARLQQSGLLDAARGDGFVFGLLAPDGDVDVPGNSALVDLARPFPCVFHRAFDQAVAGGGDAVVARALARVQACGFRGVLTAGGPGAAADHAGVLARIVAAGPALEVVVGGGVRSGHVGALVARVGGPAGPGTGPLWVHSSCLVDRECRFSCEEVESIVREMANCT